MSLTPLSQNTLGPSLGANTTTPESKAVVNAKEAQRPDIKKQVAAFALSIQEAADEKAAIQIEADVAELEKLAESINVAIDELRSKLSFLVAGQADRLRKMAGALRGTIEA